MKVELFDASAFKAPVRDPRLADWLKDYPSDVFSERLYQSIELMERYSIELALVAGAPGRDRLRNGTT